MNQGDKLKLGINIDHVATLRQQRRGKEPDPVLAALLAETAGADSIVCHLREDRRHIQEQDLSNLRRNIKTKLNLEMAASPRIIKIACQEKPDWVTLVPEKRSELTTEGGLAVKEQVNRLKDVVSEFKKFKIPVSLFIDADTSQIKAAVKTGAEIVELHTGRYADAVTEKEKSFELKKIIAGSRIAKNLGLKVAAGHGLDYRNVLPITRIPEIEELNIGYSIIGRALFVGLEEAVREMIRLIR
ncbi:MAG: pyridoxine 5'-phosphate synthase [Candidatus Omnitrophica bacterium]|nr:pyridoxine 5'-phosphate synthase [Candidatus Omnitrophota bacterium]